MKIFTRWAILIAFSPAIFLILLAILITSSIDKMIVTLEKDAPYYE